MRAKMKRVSPEAALARVLAVLEQELIVATDADIREAAQDLGMNLDMKGSAAFAGLRYPAKASLSDYFGPDALAQLQKIAKSLRGQRNDDDGEKH
ncbi:MAG: hypothetical protein ABI885_08385 [Gammaproteobacteria bacterium]